MKKALFLVVALGLMAGSALAADTVKVGLMCPLTGSYAAVGQEMKQIVELMAAELNAAGGVLNKQVAIVTEDDGSDPKTAALAAQKLSTQGVVAVIGTYGSAVTEASQPIYNEAKILQVATGSTAVRLTEKGLKYFFRTAPRDDEQGMVAAKTLQKLGFKKIAILHDNSTYAKGLADETKALLQGKAEIVFFDALTPKEKDYTAILTKIKAAGPEVVFFTGYYQEAALLLRQKKEMGWNVALVGGDATSTDLVKNAGKEAAAGFVCIQPPVPQDMDSAEAKAFIAAYIKKYNAPPADVYATLSGDAFKAIVAGIKGAGGTDPDKMAAYLKTGLKEMPGLSGKISFNDKGDRVGDLYRVYKVDAEGKLVLQP